MLDYFYLVRVNSTNKLCGQIRNIVSNTRVNNFFAMLKHPGAAPNCVHVTVHRARNLIRKGKENTNNAFVTIQLGKEKYQTDVKDKSTDPVEWHTECIFNGIADPAAEIDIEVYHANNISISEFLGRLSMPLIEFQPFQLDKPKTGWYPLRNKKSMKKAEKDRGELEVQITFSKTLMTGSVQSLNTAKLKKPALKPFKELGKFTKKFGSKSNVSEEVYSQNIDISTKYKPAESLPIDYKPQGDESRGHDSDSDDESYQSELNQSKAVAQSPSIISQSPTDVEPTKPPRSSARFSSSRGFGKKTDDGKPTALAPRILEPERSRPTEAKSMWDLSNNDLNTDLTSAPNPKAKQSTPIARQVPQKTVVDIDIDIDDAFKREEYKTAPSRNKSDNAETEFGGDTTDKPPGHTMADEKAMPHGEKSSAARRESPFKTKKKAPKLPPSSAAAAARLHDATVSAPEKMPPVVDSDNIEDVLTSMVASGELVTTPQHTHLTISSPTKDETTTKGGISGGGTSGDGPAEDDYEKMWQAKIEKRLGGADSKSSTLKSTGSSDGGSGGKKSEKKAESGDVSRDNSLKKKIVPVSRDNSIRSLLNERYEAEGEETINGVSGMSEKRALHHKQSSLPDDVLKQYENFSREDLIKMILNQRLQLEKKDSTVRDLENYIDSLLVKVMEMTPTLLQAPPKNQAISTMQLSTNRTPPNSNSSPKKKKVPTATLR